VYIVIIPSSQCGNHISCGNCFASKKDDLTNVDNSGLLLSKETNSATIILLVLTKSMRLLTKLSGSALTGLLYLVASRALAYSPPLPPDSIKVPTPSVSSILGAYGLVCGVTAWILIFGIIIGVLFVVWGGVKYVTSGGDSGGEEDAKKIIIGALIGVVFLVLAVAIIQVLVRFFSGTEITIDLNDCGAFQ
jgi:hypothetical protein